MITGKLTKDSLPNPPIYDDKAEGKEKSRIIGGSSTDDVVTS